MIRRQLAAANTAVYGPDLARSLVNLAALLAATQQRDEALAAAQEAVTAYRQLAQHSPDAYSADLARALMSLAAAQVLSPTGPPDALHAASEAAVLYLQLTARSPTAFTPHLTESLSTAADLLDLMGQDSHASHLRRLARAGSLTEATSYLVEIPGSR